MASEGQLLSIVIPCYRSAAYLASTVAELITQLEPDGPLEILLVNDGSPDRVQEVIEELAAKDVRIRWIEFAKNRGQHAAVLSGMAEARGDVVATVDDDGQNPPAAALAVVRALREQPYLDVVYGRFHSTEQTGARILASRLNRKVSAWTLGNTRGIPVTNVRAIRGDLARALGKAVPAFPYIDAMIFAATRRIDAVEVSHRAREQGVSTYQLTDLLKLWLSHMTSLTILPLRLATLGCFCAAGLGFLLGIAQMLRVLIEQRAPEGWLSLFVAVTFLFSILFAFLGVLSSYVGRLYVAANMRGLDWIRSSSTPNLVTAVTADSKVVTSAKVVTGSDVIVASKVVTADPAP